jgi:hypothetical protein
MLPASGQLSDAMDVAADRTARAYCEDFVMAIDRGDTRL